MYELSAVLIHRGISAYSGHYIAHVKDARTSDWYKFNDEEIERMEGKKLQLGTEEDIGKRHSPSRRHVGADRIFTSAYVFTTSLVFILVLS